MRGLGLFDEAADMIERMAKDVAVVSETLATSLRHGSDKDEPEGERYIQLSDTLARQLSARLRGQAS